MPRRRRDPDDIALRLRGLAYLIGSAGLAETLDRMNHAACYFIEATLEDLAEHLESPRR